MNLKNLKKSNQYLLPLSQSKMNKSRKPHLLFQRVLIPTFNRIIKSNLLTNGTNSRKENKVLHLLPFLDTETPTSVIKIGLLNGQDKLIRNRSRC